MRSSIVIFLVLLFTKAELAASSVRNYELRIEHCSVNMSGKAKVDFALCVNGKIPAPTLEFVEGEEALITVINDTDEETSVHWHGILLPNAMDGVSYVTTMPILAKDRHVFRFKIRQTGTYWYHSHTMLQEQRGVFGAFVIHSHAEAQRPQIKEHVAILSDWTDEHPDQVLANLKKDGDYYRFKKKRVPSWWGAYKEGALFDLLAGEWGGMGPMDLSDVGYDRFLLNGVSIDKVELADGEKLKVRLINGSASTYFYVEAGGKPFQIVASDGLAVSPIDVKELLLGMGETYDLILTREAGKSLELRATAQDITGFSSLLIGDGELVSPPNKALPNVYKMEGHGGHGASHGSAAAPMAAHSGHGGHGGHGGHATVPDRLDYSMLRSKEAIAKLANAQRRIFPVYLRGDMERYNWVIDSPAIGHHKSIFVKEGEVIRFELINETMMHHPMHLHGHFFWLLSSDDPDDLSKAVLKHTVDVPPFGRRLIEFQTTEPGYWLFHCHNLYHMKAGMDAQVRYVGFEPEEELKAVLHKDPHQHEHMYFHSKVELFSSFASAYLRASNSLWHLDSNIRYGYEEDISDFSKRGADLLLHRWLNPRTNVFAGALHEDGKTTGEVGLFFTLPLLIESTLSFDGIRSAGLSLEKEIALTDKIEMELELEWYAKEGFTPTFGLSYRPSWAWQVGFKAVPGEGALGLTARF